MSKAFRDPAPKKASPVHFLYLVGFEILRIYFCFSVMSSASLKTGIWFMVVNLGVAMASGTERTHGYGCSVLAVRYKYYVHFSDEETEVQ